MTEEPIFLEEGREMSEGEILARVNALYRRSEIVKLHKAEDAAASKLASVGDFMRV